MRYLLLLTFLPLLLLIPLGLLGRYLDRKQGIRP